MEKNSEKPHINVDFFEDLTGDIEARDDEGVEALGQKIRALREDKGMTLDAMSKMTGFEVDVLAQIEKNEIQPQLGTLSNCPKPWTVPWGVWFPGRATVYIQLRARTSAKRRSGLPHPNQAVRNSILIKAWHLR